MSVLDRAATARRAGPRPTDPLEVLPRPWVAGALGAVRAAAAGLVAVLAPVVLVWLVTAGGSASWAQVLQMSGALWLLGHGVALTLGTGAGAGGLTVTPIGLTLVALAACWSAGRRTARSLDPALDLVDDGRADPAPVPRSALAGFVVGYTALAVACALFARGLAHPVLWQAAAGPAVVAAAGAAGGAASHRFGGRRAVAEALALRFPERTQGWLRPAVAALAVLLGSAALVLAGALVLGRSSVGGVQHALDPGPAGGAVLTLAQVTVLPDALVWVLALLAGPGFAVGTGTSVTVAASTIGAVPAVPLLGALPAPGALPVVALALLAVPVLAGVVAGALVLRDAVTRTDRILDSLGAGLLAGVVVTVAALLAGGSAGPGRMAHVGPQPLLVGLFVAGEVAAGALAHVVVRVGLPALWREAASRWQARSG